MLRATTPRVEATTPTSKIGEIVDEKFVIERMTTNDGLDYMNRIPTSVTGEQVTRVVQPLRTLSGNLVSCPGCGELFSSGCLRLGEAECGVRVTRFRSS